MPRHFISLDKELVGIEDVSYIRCNDLYIRQTAMLGCCWLVNRPIFWDIEPVCPRIRPHGIL